MPPCIAKPYWYDTALRSSGPEPVTGPGEVDRDKKGLRDGDLESPSLAPSTRAGRLGDGGLFDADDGLLPESEGASKMYSVAPSVWEFLVAGVPALGDPFEGVPN